MSPRKSKHEKVTSPLAASSVPAKCSRRFREVEVILPCGMLSEIKDYLFRDTSKEYACYLICGHTVIGQTLRLLGCFLVLPEPSEYESHSLVSVRLRREL